jgi:hypothetical protein
MTTPEDERAISEASLHDALRDVLGPQADHVERRVVAGPAGHVLVDAARRRVLSSSCWRPGPTAHRA